MPTERSHRMLLRDRCFRNNAHETMPTERFHETLSRDAANGTANRRNADLVIFLVTFLGSFFQKMTISRDDNKKEKR